MSTMMLRISNKQVSFNLIRKIFILGSVCVCAYMFENQCFVSMLQEETSLRRHRRRKRKAFMCLLVCVVCGVF